MYCEKCGEVMQMTGVDRKRNRYGEEKVTRHWLCDCGFRSKEKTDEVHWQVGDDTREDEWRRIQRHRRGR